MFFYSSYTMKFKLIFKHYWPHVKKYPKTGIFTLVCYGLGAILASIITPIFYKRIIDIASGSITDIDIGKEIILQVCIVGGIVFTYNVLFRIADFILSYFQSNVLRELSNYAFDRIHNHSYSFFSNNFSGALVTKAKRFVRSFETIHDRITFNFVFQGIKIIGVLVVMFVLAPYVAFAYILWLLVYFLLITFFIKKKLPYDIAESNADSKVTASYADTITNALAIKMFASKKREYKKFQDVTQVEEKKRRTAWYVGNIQNTIQGFLFGLLEFIILFIAVKLWLAGSISVGTIVLMQIYVIATFEAVWQFGRALTEIAKGLADAKEMVDIFEEKPSVQNVKNPEKCRIKDGMIQFDTVSFAYDKNEVVMQNFSLNIQPGEKIGLVGHSGAGKTTITKILLRFADIQKGVISIDGQDISKITQDDLRKHISYVPQDPLLFHRSLYENISYGKPGVSMEEVVEVAKEAHAHEFIEKLPKGYDTLVGERGVKLSGGERQRVAIARAMLKDAPILILDEATSSLDSVSEKHIQEALDELMKGRTTIVVAHRLSTIQKMDRILVLEDGEIAEEGRHKSLLKKKGLYNAFWQQQAGGFLA